MLFRKDIADMNKRQQEASADNAANKLSNITNYISRADSYQKIS